jgi:hypothetical protein
MSLVMPEGVPTLGNISVKAVATIADPAAPKLATEIDAVGSQDISLHLYPAGWGPTADTPVGTAPARLGSRAIRQSLNRTTYSMPALQYVCDPQAAEGDPGQEAFDLLKEGVQIHLLERRGLDAETAAWAVGQNTRDHHITLGPQVHMGDPTDENAEFYIMQTVVYVNGDGPVDGVIVT